MSNLREILKQRAEAREEAAASSESKFPQGVTQYVRMGRNGEVNATGRHMVILSDPDQWHAYFRHEDSTFTGSGYDNKFQLHTCLHNPKQGDDLRQFMNKGTVEQCPTCGAMTKKSQRKMYFIIPVYDPEYDELRVIDTKEFHAANFIKAYDSIEKAIRKFNPDYTLAGSMVKFKQDDKTFTIESSEWENEEEEKEFEEKAKRFMLELDPSEFMFMRERPELVKIIREAKDGSLDASVVEGETDVVEDKEGEKDTH